MPNLADSPDSKCLVRADLRPRTVHFMHRQDRPSQLEKFVINSMACINRKRCNLSTLIHATAGSIDLASVSRSELATRWRRKSLNAL